MKSSSKISLFLALSSDSKLSGKWMLRIAKSREQRPFSASISDGIKSGISLQPFNACIVHFSVSLELTSAVCG